MKSPSQEVFAQLMFWTGIGCFPLSIALAIMGAGCRKIGIAFLWFFAGSIAFNHFLFYINVLGGALGTKVGRYEAPSWISFSPYSLIGVVVLVALWFMFDCGGVRKTPPPLPRTQK